MRAADERSATRPRSPGDGPMKPLAALDPRLARAVLFDIDETLTPGGKLTALAYAALERLKGVGKLVVPVTGRPAGWCDHIARMWPVDAVVGENGAFYFGFFDGALVRRFHDDAPTRTRNRVRLQGIAERILAAVPGCALASHQAHRESDRAIDKFAGVAPPPEADSPHSPRTGWPAVKLRRFHSARQFLWRVHYRVCGFSICRACWQVPGPARTWQTLAPRSSRSNGREAAMMRGPSVRPGSKIGRGGTPRIRRISLRLTAARNRSR